MIIDYSVTAIMTFEEWEQTVPDCIRSDSLWRMRVYRLGLFISDLAVEDAAKLLRIPAVRSRVDQLVRASGNISSSTAEGYSRGTGRARATFYEYSLGSARETRDWYYKCTRGLTKEVRDHRLHITTEIVKLLIAMIASERKANKRLTPGPAVTE